MKIVFFGTSEFALPALKLLRKSPHELLGVVTSPDKPSGRRQELLPSPVKVWAQIHSFLVFQPGHLKIENWKLEIPIADIYILASYGFIIPQAILELPRHGALNIHPSLLPRYRGPSPIQTVILDGEPQTGVTIIKMDERVDHGPILASRQYEIGQTKIKYRELHDALAFLGAELLVEMLPKYVSGKLHPQEQDEKLATYTKMITKDAARIDWKSGIDAVERQVRAYGQWPIAWTTLKGKRLKIYEATVKENGNAKGIPGQIVDAKKSLAVCCGEGKSNRFGILEIAVLQTEGSRRMAAKDFVLGNRNLEGVVLI